MPEVNLAAITNTVLLSVFGLTFIWGIVLQKTHFCTMGAIADVVNMGDWNRLRMWTLAIGIAMIGTQSLAAFGLIDTSKSIYTASKVLWLSGLLGGTLFGFGMVLASGCASKALVRIGGGNLKSLTVFIVVGVAGVITMKGLLGVLRVDSIDLIAFNLVSNQDLPSILSGWWQIKLATMQITLGLIIGGALILFSLKSRDFWRVDNLIGGVVTGLVVVAIWYVSGKIGYVAENPETLQESFLATNSGRMESLSFVAPLSYSLELLMYWSDKGRVLTLGITSVMGVISGAMVWALVSRSFQWEGFAGAEDTANHLIGAVLMGVGGVLALGCSIGQGLSGVSTLAIGSFIALFGIVCGAIGALKYQMWRI